MTPDKTHEPRHHCGASGLDGVKIAMIYRLWNEGNTKGQIAKKLEISHHTVRKYLRIGGFA